MVFLDAFLSRRKAKEWREVRLSPKVIQVIKITKQQLADATLLAFRQQEIILVVFVGGSDIAVVWVFLEAIVSINDQGVLYFQPIYFYLSCEILRPLSVQFYCLLGARAFPNWKMSATSVCGRVITSRVFSTKKLGFSWRRSAVAERYSIPFTNRRPICRSNSRIRTAQILWHKNLKAGWKEMDGNESLTPYHIYS